MVKLVLVEIPFCDSYEEGQSSTFSESVRRNKVTRVTVRSFLFGLLIPSPLQHSLDWLFGRLRERRVVACVSAVPVAPTLLGALVLLVLNMLRIRLALLPFPE